MNQTGEDMESESVAKVERRSFRVGDAMVLVAAVAFGLSLSRTTLISLLTDRPQTGFIDKSFATMRDSLPYVASYLATGTIACLLLGPGGGRHGPYRRFDSPGMAAVVAATVVIATQSAATALLILVGTNPGFIQSPLSWGMNSYPGTAVAGTWASLRLGGHWSRGRSWVDHLGFALGLGWIGITLAHWFGFALIR